MKLIEKDLPLQEVNLIAEYEMLFLKMIPRDLKERLRNMLGSSNLKGKNLPKIHNLMYYPARIPPSAARAVTLASVLEYDPSISKDMFLRAIGLENAKRLARDSGVLITLYVVDPDRELVKRLLGRDPREVTVVDPMAGGGSIPLESLRLGFRTIAGDYNPLAYLILRATIEFPAKYGRRLYELVEREAKMMIKYAKEELGRFYDVLAKNYVFFIGSKHRCGGVIPLAKHTLLSRRKSIHVKPVFDNNNKTYRFEISSRPSVFSTAICPYCDRSVSEEEIRREWIRKHIEILEELLDGNVQKAEEVPRIYILAAVQLGRGRYRPPDNNDIMQMVEAAKELAKCAEKEREDGRDIRDYLPVVEITEDNAVFGELRRCGIRFWHQLYNPRQLLAMYKLVKYIRNRARELYEIYGELGAAVALYLALALAKIINYNNILTQWDYSDESIRDLAGSQYALGRKVRLGYDYCEGNIAYVALPWVLEADEEESEAGKEENEVEVESTRGGILPVVKLLCNRLEGLWKEGLDAVYLWDARELDRHLPSESVDLINVDPPYYDQHDYAGITEFFWVVMQQALWPVLDSLFPQERVRLEGWHPEYSEIPRSVEIKGKPPSRVGCLSGFGEGFKKFLEAASKVLKRDGLLVVWYAYGKLHGWEELFFRFYEAGYAVTKTWQVWSQARQRRVALQKAAFFTSMVIVARPRATRANLLRYDDPAFVDDVRRTVESSMKTILDAYGLEALKEALVVSLADGYARATLYTLAYSQNILSVYPNLARKALAVAVPTVLRCLTDMAGAKLLDIKELDPVSRLYTFLLIVSTKDLRVSSDFASRISQVLGSDVRAVKSGEGRGVLRLLSPAEVARKFPLSMVSRSIRLVEEVERTLQKYGLRAAEDLVASMEQKVVSLAKLLITLSWDKLGITASQKEVLLKILQRGGAL